MYFLQRTDLSFISKLMKEDPTFKKRFGISTPIRYVPTVIVDPKYADKYKRAWKKFFETTEEIGSKERRKKFDSVLRRIENLQDDLPYTKRFAIRYIDKKVGYGVFAKVDIPPKSMLNTYGGILKPDKLIDPDNDSTFMFSDFPAFSIDAAQAGNWTRFMNHSAEGSKQTNVIAWEHYSNWGPRIMFTAGSRGIKKGTQLLYSYGEDYWDDADSFEKL